MLHIETDRLEQVINSLDPETRRQVIDAFRDEFSEHYFFTTSDGSVKVDRGKDPRRR